MGYQTRWLGLSKIVTCDRCERPRVLDHNWATLCEGCSHRDPEGLRREHFTDRWGKFRQGSSALGCSLCGAEGPPDWFVYLCHDCQGSHPDETHSGDWSKPVQHGVEIEHCKECLGLVVKTPKGSSTARRYYFVGDPFRQGEASTCQREASGGNTQRQDLCEHGFIRVFSNVRENAVVSAEDEVRQKYSVLLDLLSPDGGGNGSQKRLSAEATHFWCWQCGHYLSLRPSQYSILPIKGRLRSLRA